MFWHNNWKCTRKSINQIPKIMRKSVFTSVLVSLFSIVATFAQDKTTVRANSTDISDNLDLRAVATIFGESKDLEDFEQRLNDPNSQISNLDLNNDNYVDYLRVIESIEGNAHIIVIQAVLDKDLYQDIATVEVEKDRNNNVTVQVVGDVYMYGNNYIYEPVYIHRPIIYTTFWTPFYRPYYSNWYWGYYPRYYTFWRPFPIFRYRNHIALHINFGISFNYVSFRRCSNAYYSYYGRRANGYERRYPNRSFSNRNNGYANRYELDRNRTIRTRTPGSRELAYNQPRSTSSSPRSSNYVAPRNTSYNTPRSTSVTPKNTTYNNPRSTSSTYNNPRSTNNPRSNSPRTVSPRSNSPKSYSEPRSTATKPRVKQTRSSSGRNSTATRGNSGRNSSSRASRT